MSTIAQRAREEADRVEAEEAEAAEAEETPAVEPEPEPQMEPPADMAKVMQKLDRENDRHAREVEKIMAGDFAIVAECPLCIQGPRGFVFPLPTLPPEAQDAIRAGVNMYVGSPIPEPESLKEAGDMHACNGCDGWGVVRSGSKNPNHVIEQCNVCRGNGWKLKEYTPPPLAPVAPLPSYPGADAAFIAIPQGQADGYGRPAGHPHWGLDPASVGVS